MLISCDGWGSRHDSFYAEVSEPPAKLIVDPLGPEPLASRRVVIINNWADNLHFVPVFSPNALAVSPRIGHVHVRLDDASWVLGGCEW